MTGNRALGEEEKEEEEEEEQQRRLRASYEPYLADCVYDGSAFEVEGS